MSGNRLWVLGTIVIAIALLAGGWFLLISPQVDQASAAKEQQTTVDQQNVAAQARVAKLKADYANLAAVSAQLDALRQSLPPSADYTGFLEELNSLAKSNNVVLTAFEPSSAAVYSGSTATPAPVSTGALPDGTLVAIPVKITVSGTIANLVNFTGDLQKGTRLYLVQGLAFSGTSPDNLEVIDGQIYVGIDSSVVSPGDAVPTSPAAPTATPTATGAP